MVDPASILAAIVTKLKAIPAVVTAVTSTSNIYTHTPNFPSLNSLQQTLNNMGSPSILVAYESGQTGTDTIAWVHNVSIYVMPRGDVLSLLTAIINGIPTTDSVKFQDVEVLDTLDCAHELSILPPEARDFGDVTFDFWSIRLAYREKYN